jgi:YD repeat-containing protein
VEEANGAITKFAYDAVGNKKTMTNPLGKVWSYDYDANNQLIAETDPLGNQTEYAYTSTGQLWIKRLPNGWITKNVYNGRRLMEVRSLYGMTLEQAKDPTNRGTLESSFGYDNLGRRTSAANSEVSLAYVYDNLNRLHQVTNHTLGQTITYGYDLNGVAGRVKMYQK